MWARARLSLLSVSCSIKVFLSVGLLLRLGVSICDMAEQQAVTSARCLRQLKCEIVSVEPSVSYLLILSIGPTGKATSKDKQRHKKILNSGQNTCMCYTEVNLVD